MLRRGLRIHGQRLEIRLHDVPRARLGRKAGHFSGCRLAKPQGLLHASDRLGKTGLRAMPTGLALSMVEKISDGLCRAVDANGNALDDMRLDPGLENLGTEANDLDGRMCDPWSPFLEPDRHPYAGWDAVGELVKGERRVEADHSLGHELRGFRERVVGIKRRVGKLIEAAAELKDQAWTPDLRECVIKRGSRPLCGHDIVGF